ncbi:MAG: hypothetical protein GXO78_12115 [Calditrichaeota bacterium]|nr:hypothetical protein [Calditrichota bacterium]
MKYLSKWARCRKDGVLRTIEAGGAEITRNGLYPCFLAAGGDDSTAFLEVESKFRSETEENRRKILNSEKIHYIYGGVRKNGENIRPGEYNKRIGCFRIDAEGRV